MCRLPSFCLPLLAMAVVVGLSGCGSTGEPDSETTVPAIATNAEHQGDPSGDDHEGHDHEGHDHEGHDHEGHQHDGDDSGDQARHEHGDVDGGEVTAALAKLSVEDRALALGQKTCPVSKQALGSMGAPIKLDVSGRQVFICCGGCEDSLRQQPDKYLAAIDQR